MNRSTPGRLIRALVVSALLGLALTPVPARATDAPGCPTSGQVVPRGDGWTAVRPGTLPGVSAATASPEDSARLWATDGRLLQRSTDGGCRWSTVASVGDGRAPAELPLPQVPGTAAAITQVLVAGAPGREVVWTCEDDVVTPLGARSRVRVSTDGGAGFQATSGLPPLGRLRLGLAGPRTAYVLAATTGLPGGAATTPQSPSGTAVWVSTDSGAHFVQRATIPDIGLSAIVADAGAPGTAYAWSARQLWVTTDLGVSFRPVAVRDGHGATLPRITAVEAGPAQVAVFLAGGWVALSADAGAHLQVTAAPDGVDSAAHLPGRPRTLVVSTPTGDAAFTPGQPPVDLTPVPGGAHDLVGSRTGTRPVVLGHTPSTLYLRALVTADLSAPVLAGVRPGQVGAPVRPGALLAAGPPSLLPAAVRLTLAPGAVRRVPYRLTLPPQSGPLDVYFLVDTTPSMRDALDGLRTGVQGIVDDLARSRLDVQFGVGDFRDLDDLAGVDPARHVYRRDTPVGPPGPALSRALAALQIAAGGRDIPEAQTIALSQAATGAGLPGVVPAGQQAGFRATATKVIVLITDSPFHQDPPYPSMGQTVGDLRSRGIKVVSLAVDNSFASSDPRPDEQALALGTATLAPVEGIDCQGTGTVDVPAGAPAVCTVATDTGGPLHVAAPIAALLRGVQDPGTVDVTVDGPGLLRTVGVTSEVTDLVRPRPLEFAVEVTCRPGLAGSSLPVVLIGRVNGFPVVRAGAVVRCLAAAPSVAAVVAAPAPPPGPQPVPAGPPEVVPPGGPVVQAQPGAQPNPNPNVNPNVNPNPAGAAAEQQQEQGEPVVVTVDAGSPAGQPLGTAARTRQEHAALGVLTMALLTASTAGALQLRSRTRPSALPA